MVPWVSQRCAAIAVGNRAARKKKYRKSITERHSADRRDREASYLQVCAVVVTGGYFSQAGVIKSQPGACKISELYSRQQLMPAYRNVYSLGIWGLRLRTRTQQKKINSTTFFLQYCLSQLVRCSRFIHLGARSLTN